MYLKKIIFIFLISCFAINSQSCFKHRRQLRVKNTFSNPVKVMVGEVDYGTVGSVKTTEYKDIPKGRLEITGDIEGVINVPKGKHKYTLSINSVGIVTLIEENN
jgi:hypothetical protein